MTNSPESSGPDERPGGFSKGRLEAFSDGVIAVIITIMVLELKAPESAALADLVKLWPSFAIYGVSFTLVAIYWINHHSLINLVGKTTPALIWANNLLLFFMSLIPFATAYVASTRMAPLPTMVYAALQMACSASFALTMAAIVAEHRNDKVFLQATRSRWRKNGIAVGVYAISVAVAAFSPLAALGLFVVIAAAYVAPSLFAEAQVEGASD